MNEQENGELSIRNLSSVDQNQIYIEKITQLDEKFQEVQRAIINDA